MKCPLGWISLTRPALHIRREWEERSKSGGREGRGRVGRSGRRSKSGGREGEEEGRGESGGGKERRGSIHVESTPHPHGSADVRGKPTEFPKQPEPASE